MSIGPLINESESFTPEAFLAELAKPVIGPQKSPDFTRKNSNFFNKLRTPADFIRNQGNKNKDTNPVQKLTASTLPPTLLRICLEGFGFEVDEVIQAHIDAQYPDFIGMGRENKHDVDEMIAATVPLNAAITTYTEALGTFIEEREGLGYAFIGQHTTLFGQFVVARAVLYEQAHDE